MKGAPLSAVFNARGFRGREQTQSRFEKRDKLFVGVASVVGWCLLGYSPNSLPLVAGGSIFLPSHVSKR